MIVLQNELQYIDKKKLEAILERLLNHEPVQYVLGYGYFYGLKFLVNKNVLIPRPETEELVRLMIDYTQSMIRNPMILDIGTGSGCIAVALKKNIPDASVTALDISHEAITVVAENARINHVLLKFIQADILDPNLVLENREFDIMVSNPPYVRESEKEWMLPNVLQYEPDTALFVNDKMPLIYYESIARFANKHLKPGGKLYLEINESLGKETSELLANAEFSKLIIHQDLQHKDRMIEAEWR